MRAGALKVGDFVLQAPLGRGGMGEVWRGRHEPTGTSAAVKLLRASVADDPFYLASFRTEVRAVAGLHHPHIVRIFDHGLLEEDQPSMGGGIRAGSPWLAMELLDGPSLTRHCGQIDWPEASRLLHGLLDALAHAHARGLVHRDLKPGNVVVCQPPEGPHAVLLDFGLAQATTGALDPDEVGTVIGTAAYMAPEQFRGRDSDYGPWTDLYGLGCVAWALLAGSPPFGVRQTPHQLGQRHLQDDLPEFRPTCDVPGGFDDWLRRLLDKDPRQRFRRAADAAWALRLLDRGRSYAAHGPAGTTLRLDGLDESASADTVITGPQDAPSLAVGRPPFVLRPPTPLSWATGTGSAARGLPAGTGLGIFGIRELPVVGRQGEQDQLWAALRRVELGQPQVVLLQGPAGCGKSRLARWLAQRAHELGVVERFVVAHTHPPGAGDGLGPALARHLRVGGLPRDLAELVLRRRLAAEGMPEGELPELMRLVAPRPRSARSSFRRLLGHRFASPMERYGLVAERLLSEAAWRPLLVTLEDVQWGADTLAFAQHLLRRARERKAAVMLLLTAREMAPDGQEATLLGQLLRHAGASRVPVGPLAPGFRPAFLKELVPLDPELSERVETRSGGNPLYMVQLVESWVGQGSLQSGARGFVLASGADGPLPDGLHEVWQERLQRALCRRGSLELAALELAAVLGLELEQTEWEDAAQRAGAWASAELVEDLLQAGLAESHPDGPHQGWRFVHALLRDSLLRTAADEGRLDGLRRACAAMLTERQAEDPRAALRLGRLLLDLDEVAEAIGPLTEGAWQAVRDSEYLVAERALQQRATALEGLDAAADDPRLCEGWIMQARVARRRDQHAEAARFTRLAESTARRHGWGRLHCQALREQARLRWRRGRLLSALVALREAVELAEAHDTPLALAWCLRDFGLVSVELGDLPTAVLTRASTTFADVGEVFGRATCQLALGIGHMREGQRQAGLGALSTAADGFRESLRVQEPAHAWVGLGDVARWQGDLCEAERCYQSALQRFATIGAAGSEVARRHLATVMLLLGAWARARPVLAELRRDALEREARGQLGQVYVQLAWAHGLAGDGDEAQRHVLLAQDELARLGAVPRECFEHLGACEEALRRHGEEAAARAVEAQGHVWEREAKAESR